MEKDTYHKRGLSVTQKDKFPLKVWTIWAKVLELKFKKGKEIRGVIKWVYNSISEFFLCKRLKIIPNDVSFFPGYTD